MKFVISTSAEIGRRPMAFNWSCSHCGDGPFFTPLMTRPTNAGQASGTSVLISTEQGKLPFMVLIGFVITLPSPTAARSRAILSTPSQSGRLGVTSKSITGSLRFSASARGVPISSPASKSIIPSASSPRSSSAPEHIMPEDSTPRILRGFLSRLKSAPGM